MSFLEFVDRHIYFSGIALFMICLTLVMIAEQIQIGMHKK